MGAALAVVGGDPFCLAEEKFEELVDRLRERRSLSMDLSDMEVLLEKDGRDLLRLLLQAHLDVRGDGDVGTSVTGSDGSQRTHKRIGERGLKSIFGEVEVKRTGYSGRGSESLFPQDGALNLPESFYSHGLEKRVIREVVDRSFEESVASVERTTGVLVPKRQAEEMTIEAARDFEGFYEQECSQEKLGTAQEKPLLILTSDAKGVVMRREDLREETKKRAGATVHHLEKRLSKGEKRNAKRMATVASVYHLDRFVRTPEEIAGELAPIREVKEKRPRPSAKRVWASLEKTPEDVTRAMFEEGLQRDPRLQKEWVALVDGDPKQIGRIESTAKEYGIQLTLICDLIHVVEYLWKAARAFHPETSSQGETWVRERLLKILQGEAVSVAAGMRRSATNRRISERGPVDTCADYLLNHQDYLHYDLYLRKGYPIATGVIEGACRHLVKDRMDVTGARWSLEGAEAVLKLRSVKTSGDFEAYWEFHEEKELERNHRSRYAKPSVLNKFKLKRVQNASF